MWNGRGIDLKKVNGVKKDQLKNSNADICQLNEQWSKGELKGYKSEVSEDIHTGQENGIKKINVSALIREEIKYERKGENINNAIILIVPEVRLVITVCYARPGEREVNEQLFKEIEIELEEIMMDKKNWGIILYGDFNKFEYIWEEEGAFNMEKMKQSQGTHVNTKNKTDKLGELQQIYTKFIKAETKIIQETQDKVSDHAMIFMKCNAHLHVQMNVHMNVGMSNILNVHQND